MIKAVCDTNILVSGLISSKGAPSEIIYSYYRKDFMLVLSGDILSEVKKVLNYPKLFERYNLSKEIIKDYILGLTVFAHFCNPSKKILKITADPSDNMFLDAGVAASASYIVSGDKHLLELKEYEGIKIINARDFIKIVKGCS